METPCFASGSIANLAIVTISQTGGNRHRRAGREAHGAATLPLAVAHRQDLLGRTVRWCRRNPRLAVVSAAAAIVILTLSGAKTALMTTKGFRDALEMRRGIREEQYNNHYLLME